MNYLAHLFLARPTPHEMLGNLLADFIKGIDLSTFPPGVQSGIHLHRKIDAFTDRHPVVFRSIRRLNTNWGWFSGIIVDIYYDHLLACDFDCYSAEPLERFAARVYQILQDHWQLIPPSAQWAIEKLIETNRLVTYSTLEGIEDSLWRLSQRIQERMPKKEVHLERAIPELQQQHDDFQTDFREFFPELVAYVRQQAD